MNTFQLSCFMAVAEYLNFTQAAEKLHVTHPAVSQQIQSLEKELNVKLFQRTTRTVRLTEEGKAFLQDAQQIVDLSERAKKRLSSAIEGTIETLAIGCYNFPCMFLLSDTLEMLQPSAPSCTRAFRRSPFSIFTGCWRRGIWTPWWALRSSPIPKSTHSTGRLQRFRWSASAPASTHWQARRRWVWKN